VWYAIINTSPIMNVCECSGFICMFPLGIVLYIAYIIKNKKQDTLSTILSVLSVFFFVWCVSGFPEIVAKLTLMSYSQAGRSAIILQFISLILFIRVLFLFSEKGVGMIAALIMSVLTVAVTVWVNYRLNPEYTGISLIWAVTGAALWGLYFALMTMESKIQKTGMAYVLLFMLFTGSLVNPIRMGSNDMSEVDELKAVSLIVDEDPDGVWVVEGAFPVNNFLLTVGAETINCTNVYPYLERWKMIDTTGEYEDIYNRYAHIMVNIVEESSDSAGVFSLRAADSFEVSLTAAQLKTIGAEYVFTATEHEDASLELLEKVDSYYIYKIR